MKKITTYFAPLASLLLLLSVTGATVYFGWNYMLKPDLLELKRDLPELKAEISKTVSDVKAMPLKESVPLIIGTSAGTGFLVWDLWKNRVFCSNATPAEIKASTPFNFKSLKWGALSLSLSIPLSLSSWTIPAAILLFGVGLNVTTASLVCLVLTPVRLATHRVLDAVEKKLSRPRE